MMYVLSTVVVAALATSGLASPGYVKLDFEKRFSSGDRLMRRQESTDAVEAPLLNNQGIEYLINVTIGTPPQHLSVTLDTGSSDLWVPSSQSRLCRRGDCDFGSFNSEDSSTYKVIDEGGFNITYLAPGDSDAGDWAVDTVTVGGSPPIHDQQIGVALEAVDHHGVVGVGFDTNESPNESPNGIYPSVMDNFKNQGIIMRKAFSLYLNAMQDITGAIIFGGIDTAKYTGDLVAMPMMPDSTTGSITNYMVALTSISFTDGTGETTQLTPPDYAQKVVLDSGTTQTLVTNDVFTALMNGLGAVDVGNSDYAVPCRFRDLNSTINYGLGGADGVTIRVPMSQLVRGELIAPKNFEDKSGACDLGLGPLMSGVAILGDTFLRSAYAVFDLENQVAALAQAVFNHTEESSIVAIPSGTTIPGASVTATATATEVDRAEASASPTVAEASVVDNRSTTLILTGTPTFNLGSAATATDEAANPTSSSTGGAAHGSLPTAALLGLGMAAAGIVAF